MNIKKKKYVAPALTIVAFSTERGYASSTEDAVHRMGWALEQEIYLMQGTQPQQQHGELNAYTFTNDGTTFDGGWLGDGASAESWF